MANTHTDGGWALSLCATSATVGLEDDRRLSGAWLIAGVLSEAALIGMLITSLQEPGRAASVVLVLVVALLGLAMGVHLVRYRIDGQPRASSRQS